MRDTCKASHQRSPALLFKKPKTITVSHNQQTLETRPGPDPPPSSCICKQGSDSLRSLCTPHPLARTYSYLRPSPRGTVSVWFTHSKQTGIPLQQQEKLDVGFDESEDGRRTDGGSNVVHMREEGGETVKGESESCHKTTIIEDLSASQ